MRVQHAVRGAGRTPPPAPDLSPYLRSGGAEIAADEPADIDAVTAAVLVRLPDNIVNGYVVKVAADDTEYGKGQAFLVLEEGTGDATDSSRNGSIVFRVDARGSIGTTGGLHVATGLRELFGGSQAVWIDPAENVHGIIIHNPSVAESAVWDHDYVRVVDVRNNDDVVFRIKPDGQAETTKKAVVCVGLATQTTVGDVFGVPGVGFGPSADTLLYRAAAGVVAVANVMEYTEVAAPAAPAANKARLFARDSGAGKTQLCVRFPTGAIQVLATEP